MIDPKERSMETGKMFSQLIEAAKKNRKGFLMLKTAVATCQQFELAAHLRDIEKQVFPETEETKQAKALAGELELALRMVQLKIAPDICWLIYQTFKEFDNRKEKFAIDDATKLMFEWQNIFLTE